MSGCPQIIDLFSGAGGFSLGAHHAGFRTALAIDKDQDLTYSYKLNFPRARFRTLDLSLVEPQYLLKTIGSSPGRIEGIIGGPPCQGFSYIGKRDINDPRNALVHKFFHFVNVIQPAFFVMENVLGILDQPFRNLLDSGIDSVSHRYKIIGPIPLNASEFGAATARPRIFIIGYQSSRMNPLNASDIDQLKVKNGATVFQALHDLPGLSAGKQNTAGDFWAKYNREPETGAQGNYARQARKFPVGDLAAPLVRQARKAGLISGFQPTIHSEQVLKRFKEVRRGGIDKISRCPRLSWDEACTTLRAGTGKDKGSYQSIRPIHPVRNRVITVREAARLQGFPDWFQFHPTKWHSFRMIGNSVSPYLAETVLQLLRKRLD